MPQVWISEVLPPPHLCFPGSHRRWQIFNIYAVSYTLIANCTNCQSRFIRPLISCQTLLGASVCPRSSVFLPSRSSCTAGTCPWHREMLGMLPLHSTGTAVSISVCTLLIQGCIQGAGTELPVNVALINPIIDGIRSDSVHSMSARYFTPAQGGKVWSKKLGKAVTACLSRMARYLSLIIH